MSCLVIKFHSSTPSLSFVNLCFVCLHTFHIVWSSALCFTYLNDRFSLIILFLPFLPFLSLLLLAHGPVFGPCLLWPNGWMDQDTTSYGGRLRCRPHCARMGPSSPFSPQKRGTDPQFSARVYCGQTTGWVKMPLGIMEVGLGPDHIVLDGDPDP